jgi:hypothetical protein
VRANIKEHASWFHRFDVFWTPTALILDANGSERFRIEGYLPKSEFRAELELGLARVALEAKKWNDAENAYKGVVQRFPESSVAPEAAYWSGVSHYQRTHDHKILGQVARETADKYPKSSWSNKASIWL